MNRYAVLAVLVTASLPFTVGCTSKNYVRNEVTPTVNKVNELDDLTAKNTRDIRDVDQRAQQGISRSIRAQPRPTRRPRWPAKRRGRHSRRPTRREPA